MGFGEAFSSFGISSVLLPATQVTCQGGSEWMQCSERVLLKLSQSKEARRTPPPPKLCRCCPPETEFDDVRCGVRGLGKKWEMRLVNHGGGASEGRSRLTQWNPYLGHEPQRRA